MRIKELKKRTIRAAKVWLNANDGDGTSRDALITALRALVKAEKEKRDKKKGEPTSAPTQLHPEDIKDFATELQSCADGIAQLAEEHAILIKHQRMLDDEVNNGDSEGTYSMSLVYQEPRGGMCRQLPRFDSSSVVSIEEEIARQTDQLGSDIAIKLEELMCAAKSLHKRYEVYLKL